MRISVKRADAIYDAVFDRLMNLRVDLAQNELNAHPLGTKIDTKIAQAMDQAAKAAVDAAKGKQH